METVIKFWCRNCRIDFNAIAKRGFHNSEFTDVWMAKCPQCNSKEIRLINNPTQDPYYRLSEITHVHRKRFKDDLIQIDDPMFDLLYPQHRREKEEKLLAKEKIVWEKKHANS